MNGIKLTYYSIKDLAKVEYNSRNKELQKAEGISLGGLRSRGAYKEKRKRNKEIKLNFKR